MMTHHTHDPQQVEDRWDAIRSQFIDRWPQLTKEDLQLIDGDSRKLVALVHQKTGANLQEIEAGIDEIAASSSGLLGRVAHAIQQGSESLTEGVAHAHEVTKHHISDSPAKSVAIAFGVGLLAGLFVTATLISPSSQCEHRRWSW